MDVRIQSVGALIVCLALALCNEASAQEAVTSGTPAANYGHTLPVPAARASHRTTPIILDAKLDEAAWQSATPITDFTQSDPDEGKPASQRTDVRFLYDDDALYIGAKMYDSNGARGVMTRLV